MPVSVPARQVRLGNKKVHLMVKKAEWKNGVGRYLEREEVPWTDFLGITNFLCLRQSRA